VAGARLSRLFSALDPDITFVRKPDGDVESKTMQHPMRVNSNALRSVTTR
jgi:hypothetical protein